MPEFAPVPVDNNAFASGLGAAQNFRANEQMMDLRSQLAPYEVQDAQQRSVLNDYAIKGAQQKQELTDQAMTSQQIAMAAQQAELAPDPEAAWDENFKALQAKGIAQAGQFVGRYSPMLASRVSGAYANDAGAAGGPTRAKAAAAAQEGAGMDFDRAFASVPPQQIPQILERTGQMMDALSKVRNAQDWEAMKAAEVKAGFPQAASLGAFSPLTIPRLYDHLLQQFNYLQNRAADQMSGAPNPLIQGKVENVGGQLFAVNDRTETGMPTVTPLTANPKAAEMGGMGDNPFAGGGVGATPPGYVSLQGAAQRVMSVENSTGNTGAKNPLSSATGNGQFINSTWLKLVKEEHPELIKAGMTDKELLDLRNDPDMSAQMTQAYMRDNGMALAKEGHPITTATLALAHRFGASDADKLLNATPNTPVEDVVSKQVMDANPDLRGQSVGQVVARLQQKVGNDPVAMGNNASALIGTNVHGDQFLGSLDSATRAQVKALLDGRMQFPSSFAQSKPYWQQMYRLVAQADPNFDMVDYNARAKTRNDFAAGKSAQNITSFNTAIGHLGNLDKSIDDLNNSNFPGWNKLSNWANVEGGNTRYQSALKNFQTAKQAVADELTRAFRGSGGSVHDVESWEKTLNEADSPQALHAAVANAVDLLHSRVEALGDQYNRGMGTTRDPMTLLSPHALQTLKDITGHDVTQPATRTASGEIRTPGSPPRAPAEAVQLLRQHPEYRNQFDAKYGKGASERALATT